MNRLSLPGPAAFHADLGAWILSGHAHVTRALGEAALAPTGHGPEAAAPVREVRSATRAGTRAANRAEGGRDAWARAEAEAERLAAGLARGAPVDLVQAFAAPWGLALAATAAGLPAEAAKSLAPVAREVFGAAARARSGSGADRAAESVATLGRALAGRHGDRPGAAADPQAFVALSQTLPLVLAGAWWALALHPEEFRRLREAPSRLERGVDELLRWAGPSRAVFRRASRAVRVGEAEIGAGDEVILALAAANRDPARYPDPDRLDLERDARDHVALGAGAHRCPGAPWIRRALVLATRVLVRGAESLTPAGEPAWCGGFSIGGPETLPMVVGTGGKNGALGG